MKKYLEQGDAEQIGKLMLKSQREFDNDVAIYCKEELTSPVLHSLLNDERVYEYAYGGKGVGSQGYGSAQFICKDKESQSDLINFLINVRGMEAYPFTLNP